MGRDGDADYGLTPREWLDGDLVPLTPDIDFNDPEQRLAWIRANNEENAARSEELAQRRSRGQRADRAESRSATTVVGVRLLNAEQRALVRVARREGVTVSDLVRRWVRGGLALAEEVDPQADEPDDRGRRREEVQASADAAVVRITDELRRLREIVAGGG